MRGWRYRSERLPCGNERRAERSRGWGNEGLVWSLSLGVSSWQPRETGFSGAWRDALAGGVGVATASSDWRVASSCGRKTGWQPPGRVQLPSHGVRGHGPSQALRRAAWSGGSTQGRSWGGSRCSWRLGRPG